MIRVRESHQLIILNEFVIYYECRQHERQTGTGREQVGYDKRGDGDGDGGCVVDARRGDGDGREGDGDDGLSKCRRWVPEKKRETDDEF
jgi:hypothetical protein